MILLLISLTTVLIHEIASAEVFTQQSNIYFKITAKTPINVYWNVPTFQCDYHKLNFTGLAVKYGIIQNVDDRFRGDRIDILYDPGDFPALIDAGNKTEFRNGGIPQQGSLKRHLEVFEKNIDQMIPDTNFSGLAIIDFESWRPIFRQNFGSLTRYKAISIETEKIAHPFWPNKFVEKEATKKFEFYGRMFMEETLVLAKQLRPKASWGYYAYPYCFNMAPNNMQTNCPVEVQRENERLSWLFRQTGLLLPSIYLSENTLTPAQKLRMIEGRINEAHRIVGYLQKKKTNPLIVPYFWYKYFDTRNFLTKEDLRNSLLLLSTLNIDGLILWGSSSDVNTKPKCLSLYNFINDVLGPILINSL